MAMYTSISGMGSFAFVLFAWTSSLYWATTLCIAAPSMPMYSMNVRAVALLGEYVRMMTEHSTRSVRRFRSDDIERRARRAKRESNWVTARSSRAKLLRMSVVVGSARPHRYLREAKSMALRCVSHILPGVVQSLHVQREAKGAPLCVSMGDMLGALVLTGDGLLLCLLGGGLLRRSDDAFHAVRHGCRGRARGGWRM